MNEATTERSSKRTPKPSTEPPTSFTPLVDFGSRPLRTSTVRTSTVVSFASILSRTSCWVGWGRSGVEKEG